MSGKPTGPGDEDHVAKFLADIYPRAAAAIDQACEQALQTGFMGVRVVRRFETNADTNEVTWVLEAQATPEVPYGMIEDDGRLCPMGISRGGSG